MGDGKGEEGMKILLFLSDAIIPLLIFSIVGYGLMAKQNVYDLSLIHIYILNIVEENGVKIKEIKIDGGASKNNLLAQTLADYCDAEIMRPESLEATALGAAYMVALYANLISSEDVKGLVKIESEFKPEIKKEKMKEHYEYWKDAVERSKKWIKA